MNKQTEIKHITIKELIELLKPFDENMFVDVEGCDCTGEASGVVLMHDNKTVLITRCGESQ